MSVNQSGLRRTIGKNESDTVPKGVRSADLFAGAFYLGLNVIGFLGEFTKVFVKYGTPNSGVAFLYKTFCFPAALIVSRFFSLKGDMLYVWIMAQIVFIISAFFLWIIFIVIRTIFRALFS